MESLENYRADKNQIEALKARAKVISRMHENNQFIQSNSTFKNKDVPVFEDFALNDKDNCLAEVTFNSDSIITRLNGRAIQELKNDPSRTEYQDLILKKIFTKQENPKESNKRQNASEMAQSGFSYPITTLTHILADPLNQIYPTDDLADKFSYNREAGWNDIVVKNVYRANTDGSLSAFRTQGSNNQKLKNITFETSHESYSISTYAWEIPGNIIEEYQAGVVKLDLPGEKMKSAQAALTADYTKAIFVGDAQQSIQGFLTNPNIFVDNTLFGGLYFSQMTPTQLNNVSSNMITEGYANANAALFPNRFIFSSYDGTGTGSMVSVTYPTNFVIRNQIENIMIEGAKSSNMPNSDIKVMVTPYVDAQTNGKVTQYALYNNGPDNLQLLEPIGFTWNVKMSYNGFNNVITGYMRSGGVAVYRPTSVTQFFINNA